MDSQAPYQPVAQFPDFPAMERRLLDYWREIGAFARLREKINLLKQGHILRVE